MRSISDTIARLQPRMAAGALGGAGGGDHLTDMPDFGANPGALRARTYVPASLAPGAALVVVLHGCTQTAAAYDHGSGWSEVAERDGFALLFPEQTRGNNPNLCFNWFQSGDTTRGAGEVASVRAMIAAMVDAHALDPARIFVTGLSAGGAMASAMLATYPEVFAGGAIIAGLPYGTAASVMQAMERMRGSGLPDAGVLANSVREASTHTGPWPRVAIWHGSADATVALATGEAALAQWRAVHDLPATPTEETIVDGHPHRIWRDHDGRIAIEAHVIPGMGHGTPLDSGADGIGVGGAYMLDVGVSSTLRIAESWGLSPVGAATVAATPARPAAVAAATAAATAPAAAATPKPRPSMVETQMNGVSDVIEGALRAAGLMR